MRAARSLAALALVIAGACSGGPSAPLPPAPPVVEVTMLEYAVVPVPGVVAKGRVVLRVTNTGKRDHRLLVIPLPKDFPPIREQLRGDTRRNVQALATVPTTGPTQTNSLALDLGPGRVGLVCPLIEPGTGVSYSSKGMGAEFRVR